MTQLAPETDARLTQLAEDLSALIGAYSGRQTELVGALRELRQSCAPPKHSVTEHGPVSEAARQPATAREPAIYTAPTSLQTQDCAEPPYAPRHYAGTVYEPASYTAPTSSKPESAQAVGDVLDRRFRDSGIGPLKRDYDYFADLEEELLAIGIPIGERWEPAPEDNPSISSEAPMTVATDPSAGPAVAPDSQAARTGGSVGTWTAVQMPTPQATGIPAPGDLSIRGRTAWKTWHVLGLVACCLLGGMALDYFAGPSTAAKPVGSSGYALPPPAATGSASGSGTGSTATSPSGGTSAASSTSGATSSTGTTVAATGAGTTTSTTVAASPVSTAAAVVLVPAYQGTGNWSGQSFTVASGSWDIGWAYRCVPVPASGASLSIYVSPQGGPASQSPAISETGASGNDISTETTTGDQTISVQAPPGCVWKIKVTGVGTPG